MRKKLSIALSALLALALVPLAGVVPAQADSSKGSTLAVQNVTVTPPPSLAGKAAAPAKTITGDHHRIPGAKGGVSALALSSGYHYAGAQETPASGQGYFHSNMYVSQPTCSGAGNHSLAELTMQAGSTSGSYTDNIIEWGYVCEPNAFGDTKVRLFASCWVNGVWQASYVGGCGYVDNGSNAVNLGADLTATGLNHLTLTKKFAIQYNTVACGSDSDGMWIWYDTNWVGCFPLPGGANRLASTFTAGQFFQAFDETYKVASPGACLGMGNDLFPTTTTTPTAYFNTLSHVTTGAANGQFNTAVMTDPTVYGALKLTSAVWRTGGIETGSPNC
jgi:hypothetical protein